MVIFVLHENEVNVIECKGRFFVSSAGIRTSK